MRQITGVHIEADSICMKADDFDWALAEIRSLRQFHEWATPQIHDHGRDVLEIERLAVELGKLKTDNERHRAALLEIRRELWASPWESGKAAHAIAMNALDGSVHETKPVREPPHCPTCECGAGKYCAHGFYNGNCPHPRCEHTRDAVKASGCPDAAHMGEHACANKSQCWEPCGELGHSGQHAKASGGCSLTNSPKCNEWPQCYCGRSVLNGEAPHE